MHGIRAVTCLGRAALRRKLGHDNLQGRGYPSLQEVYSAHGPVRQPEHHVRVFRTLADPTRRLLLDRLFERDDRTLGELEAQVPGG